MSKKIDLEDLNKFSDTAVSYAVEKPKLIRIKEHIFSLYDFRYNKVRLLLEYRKKNEKDWIDFDEDLINDIWINFELNNEFHSKEKPSTRYINTVLFSSFVAKYNPIHDYFSNLKYDGNSYISQLIQCVEIEPLRVNDDYTLDMFFPLLFKRWLVACVACALGYNANHVLFLLIGGQGTFKTTFLKHLAPKAIDDYCFTGQIDLDIKNKDTLNYLAEKFIINLDDQLQSLYKKDFNVIKTLITASDITNRKAFRRDDKKRKRIANWCGSIDKEKIFLDEKNRRYLSFKIKKIDLAKFQKINIDNVWAEAYDLLKKGERFFFDSEEVNYINQINRLFSIETPEEEWLLALFNNADKTDSPAEVVYLMFNEILSIMQRASGLRMEAKLVTIAMKKLDWSEPISQRIGIDKTPRKVYAVVRKFYEEQGKIIMK
ncbi:MAG TPA: VapE family protein [Chitinophagales bacterium]|nr:VapE family protein [Chitinophagales bacterium]HMW12451.1 VapE family protein [Chitinophagales bacterium]HMX59762.1 VapE family protein [Chitinophagales bacterium]HMY22570.1 VapE family protein [Chitinophagales bacterium]HMZ33418.1 VapE family protein [Chitinophagales bacterium]